MKLPLSWLNDFVKVDDIPPAELAERLTRAGLQVESIDTVGGEPLSELIVVGEVVACEPHPDSDHLHVCRVTDGAETFQVVCGAPNMRLGLKTAFAKIGSPIPGFLDKKGNPEKIKKGKIRGVESFGMCCSEKELCIGAGNAGIIEFPPETPVGACVRDVANIEKPETVFDVDVTWNRPDALSIVGLAREFSAILHRPLTMPDVSLTTCATPVGDEIRVRVECPQKCLRYTARVVTEMTPDVPSPDWMAKRLELCGVRSINLAVDVTNYVMLELGQPLHAFDHRTLEDRTIVVREAHEGETIVTLDGVERKLDPSMLVICDAHHPQAVAGVMGGEHSGIAPGTTSVLLESALFDPVSTKATSTKLGLSSESSARYIRGVDKGVADLASRRAAHLLQKYANAKIAEGIVDVDNRTPDAPVTLRFDRARALIGLDISNDEMVSILTSLQLTVTERSEAAATFAIPSWRWDLTIEADLVEEIARIYGLDNLPDVVPCAPSVSPLSDELFRAKCRVRELCLALGFSEATHYSFLSARDVNEFSGPSETRLVIPDPVSADFGVMRDSLLPQLYQTIGRNAAHEESVAFFEMGKVFSVGPSEKEMLGLGFAGPVGREALRRRAPVSAEEAMLWMKGVLVELIAKLHAGHVEFAPAEHPACEVALSVTLNGKTIGLVGAVSSRLRHAFRLSTQLVLCELELKMLLTKTQTLSRVKPVPAFPSIRRDLALTLSQGVTHEAILKTIRQNGGKILANVELFDVFKSSRGYALEFRSAEKTLTDAEVGVAFARVVDALRAMAGVEVREG